MVASRTMEGRGARGNRDSLDSSTAAMRITIGPELRTLAVRYWARFGYWPESLLLPLNGAPVPGVIVKEAEAARVLELADQAIRDASPSGLLPAEEVEFQVPLSARLDRKLWVPDMTGVCRYCGNRHRHGKAECG